MLDKATALLISSNFTVSDSWFATSDEIGNKQLALALCYVAELSFDLIH